VPHIKISGKGGKTRYVPLHPAASRLIHEHLTVAGHELEKDGALFRSFSNNRIEGSQKTITPDGVYKMLQKYSEKLGFKIGAHSLRATAATNALENLADIAKIQEWLDHANIATTRIYDHRKARSENNPTFKVVY